MTTTSTDLPLLIKEVECVGVERLSPSFVRVELASPALADLGPDEKSYDQRIKLILPEPGHRLPSFEGADETWFASWLEKPVEERGHLRTYTARAIRRQGADTRLVVDIVVHEGDCGPAGAWGATAQVGDKIMVMAPRRGHAYGGIEFVPGAATSLLLVGDETAVPAIAAILEQLDDDAQGRVFLEVPLAADALDLTHPDGITLTWLPREGGPRGIALHAAVLAHLGAAVEVPEVDDVDPDLWETPTYSSSGEDVVTDAPHPGLYTWIAGESQVVTGLRRALVDEVGIDRQQVAFMGYWRLGVAMKS